MNIFPDSSVLLAACGSAAGLVSQCRLANDADRRDNRQQFIHLAGFAVP